MQPSRQAVPGRRRGPAGQVPAAVAAERPRILDRLSAVGGEQGGLPVADAPVVVAGLDDDGVEMGEVGEGKVVGNLERQLQQVQVEPLQFHGISPLDGGRSSLIWVRCMMRWDRVSKPSRRCMVQRLSQISRSPTRHW